MRSEKGFALVLTLVVTALMVAITTELIHQVYVDTALSRGFRDGQQASLLAESGIDGGVKLLQATLAINQTYSIPVTPLKQDDETGSIEISSIEESGKINLNDLSINPKTQDMLRRLGKQLKIPDDVWNALADWLDSDDLGGAETPYYQTLKPPYKARNGKMTLTELSLIRGFTPEIVARLRPFVTVYPREPQTISQININTAPKEVVMALADGISESMAERVLEERKLHPFTKVAELSNISGFGSIAQGIVGFATTKGDIFRIISIARVKDATRTVEAVVNLNGNTKLSWLEY